MEVYFPLAIFFLENQDTDVTALLTLIDSRSGHESLVNESLVELFSPDSGTNEFHFLASALGTMGENG